MDLALSFRSVCLLGLILGFSVSRAQQTATVLTSDPIPFVKGASRVTIPVQPDQVFQVIAVNGDQVTIADAQGFQATLNRNLLKITDLKPAPNVVPTPTPSPAPPMAATTPAPTPAPSGSGPGSQDAAMIKQLNDTFQIPLFADDNLWTDYTDSVAARLQWPQESKTPTDASYRRYALGKTVVDVLGARAYSMALYGRDGHPTSVSIVFANKGDLAEMSEAYKKKLDQATLGGDDFTSAMQALSTAVKSDVETINAQLTALLGPPETHVFGPTADSRVSVHRWDWQDHAILLSSPRDEYAAIKIVPKEVADNFGEVANLDREAIKEQLAARVLKRDNGDVIIQDIPMVDQGPKGYCVPATWERYLRYVDVPADMYVLAMLGNTGLGGGTSVDAIRAGVNDYVGSYGRRIETADVPLDISHINRFIDQGLPLMWCCYVVNDVEKSINKHTIQRKTVTDWDAYKSALDEDDKKLPLGGNNPITNGHMRMIIGYNSQTDEIAISDSWGTDYTERWMSVKEAQGTTQYDLEYIQW